MAVYLVTVEVLNFVRIYDSIKEKEVRRGPGLKSSLKDTVRAIDYRYEEYNPWTAEPKYKRGDCSESKLITYAVEIELSNDCFNKLYALAESAKLSVEKTKQNCSEFLNTLEELVKQNMQSKT